MRRLFLVCEIAKNCKHDIKMLSMLSGMLFCLLGKRCRQISTSAYIRLRMWAFVFLKLFMHRINVFLVFLKFYLTISSLFDIIKAYKMGGLT
ncbi:hypothetical protein PRIP_08477 [Listeria riparia FSL S10-1204]|uniref:Uncharacterized protein n=1 Tax=Listeria riparia FSL S10-1204 TaxID=1265816 RepID=W7DHP1_9LIST|nr:hypothetical protein PRIP_08477 [Listeria riparia FSL S10-1204]